MKTKRKATTHIVIKREKREKGATEQLRQERNVSIAFISVVSELISIFGSSLN